MIRTALYLTALFAGMMAALLGIVQLALNLPL
jgi:hypothetical protein